MIRFDDSMSRTLFWLIAGGVLFMGSMVIAPFVGAIMWASVLSVLTYPLYKWLLNKKWPDVAAAACITILTLLMIILPILGFATAAFMQGSKAFTTIAQPAPGIKSDSVPGAAGAKPSTELSLQTVAKSIDQQLEPVLGKVQIEAVRDFRLAKFLEENGEEIKNSVVGPATRGAVKFGTAIASAVVALLTMFFMLKDGHKLLAPTLHLIPLPRDEALLILGRLRETIFSVFAGVVFVALIQGGVAGIAYWVCGVPGALIWACATFVFAMIPLVGPPVVFVPIAISLYLQGKVTEAIGLVVFGALILTQIDNVLRPFFIGAKASLHPIAVFFSLLGGVILMGPIGLMAGPVILTMCTVIAEVLIARRKLMEIEAGRMPEAVEEGAL